MWWEEVVVVSVQALMTAEVCVGPELVSTDVLIARLTVDGI